MQTTGNDYTSETIEPVHRKIGIRAQLPIFQVIEKVAAYLALKKIQPLSYDEVIGQLLKKTNGPNKKLASLLKSSVQNYLVGQDAPAELGLQIELKFKYDSGINDVSMHTLLMKSALF